jgi:hypothetical protein
MCLQISRLYSFTLINIRRNHFSYIHRNEAHTQKRNKIYTRKSIEKCIHTTYLDRHQRQRCYVFSSWLLVTRKRGNDTIQKKEEYYILGTTYRSGFSRLSFSLCATNVHSIQTAPGFLFLGADCSRRSMSIRRPVGQQPLLIVIRQSGDIYWANSLVCTVCG